jgi:GNAT superfamily N-acetyltransferase
MGDERATRTTLRDWRAGEVAAVLRLWKAANATPSATDNVEAVQRLVDSDAGILLVAEAGGRLVGTVIAGWDGWRGNIYRPAVLPGWRLRGIGADPVRAAGEWLRVRGARRISGPRRAAPPPGHGLLGLPSGRQL